MQNQEKIQDLIPSDQLEVELKNARFIKATEHGNNEIYTFSGIDCPKLMLQVGILREMSFRNGGGGTGLSFDIDHFDEFADKSSNGFKQLIVWDPEDKEIVGGYRYAKMTSFINGDYTAIDSPTSELFDFSADFIRNYATKTIELGRSFVQPKYQLRGDQIFQDASKLVRKAMYALDNLFDGLGTLVVDYKKQKIEYFFGKVTMYKTYNRQARNMILYYMQKHFPDAHGLVSPKSDLVPPGLKDEIDFLSSLFVGNSEKADKKILIKSLREIKEGMPPLFKKYTEMSPTMKMFGTSINHHCGEVEETAILLKIEDLVEEYKKKYIWNYFQKKIHKYLWSLFPSVFPEDFFIFLLWLVRFLDL